MFKSGWSITVVLDEITETSVFFYEYLFHIHIFWDDSSKLLYTEE